MPVNISTITIDTSKVKVWDCLTQPGLVKRWQYGSVLDTDWAVGSPIRFKTEWDGKIFEQWGKVLEVNPPDLLKYSLFAPAPGREDIPENYFIMKYVLTEENGKTKLEINQQDDRPNAVQEEPQGEENPVLQMLKQVAEEQ